jgi:hypothetical protein
MDPADQTSPRIALFTQVKSYAIAKTLIRQASISLIIWALLEIIMLVIWTATFPVLSGLLLAISIMLLFKQHVALPLFIILISVLAFAAAFVPMPWIHPYNPFVAFVLFMLGVRILEGILFLKSVHKD